MLVVDVSRIGLESDFVFAGNRNHLFVCLFVKTILGVSNNHRNDINNQLEVTEVRVPN